MFRQFEKIFFDHVGRTLQQISEVLLIADVIAVIVFAIASGDALIGLIIFLTGFGACILCLLPLYAFGQLVEDVRKIKENTQKNEVVSDELPEL